MNEVGNESVMSWGSAGGLRARSSDKVDAEEAREASCLGENRKDEEQAGRPERGGSKERR